MSYVIWMFALMSATWIYWDAAGKKIGKVPGGFGRNYSAGGWAIFATLIPIVGLIIYLRQRPKLIEQASLHPVEASTGLKVTHGVLTIFVCIALLGVMGSRSSSTPVKSATAATPSQVADSSVPDASSPVASPVTADPIPETGQTLGGDLTSLPWNTSNENGLENGNLDLAFKHIEAIAVPKAPYYETTVERLLRDPWKHYGKIECFWITITDATNFPPGSEISQRFNNAEVGELVGADEKGQIVSMIVLGGSGGSRLGFNERHCGFVAGRAPDDQGNNRLIMITMTDGFKPNY